MPSLAAAEAEAAYQAEPRNFQAPAPKGFIRGRDIKEGTRVKTWFMPNGTFAVCLDEYRGPLQHLWPRGARVIGFMSATRSGVTGMTVGNDDLLELA